MLKMTQQNRPCVSTRHSSGNRTYGMSYYLNGNKKQENDTVNSVVKNYNYTSLGQLSNENETKNNAAVYSASYTYTPYGNRQQMIYTSGGTTEVTDYTYDGNNRLTNEATSVSNDVKSAVRYYYDENGNTTAEQKSVYTTTGTQSSNMSMSGHSGGSTMKLYRYDEFNRLIKYNDDGTEAKYTYGVDNLRATKTVNGATTSYVWNGRNLASETKNNATTVYYYDPLGVNGAKTDNDTFVRYIKDPHGNVVATSKNSTLFGTYDYTAFGNQLEATDTTNPFRYCGEYYDEESGLTYLRNRYYNSTTGRFLTEDPAKDGVNWYVYGNNNPVKFVDPTGLGYDEVINALNKIYSSRSTMESYPSYDPIFEDAYHDALAAKDMIRNSDVYIENWGGLTDTLNTIVNGDNNTQQAILNVKNAVIASKAETDKQNFVDNIVFVGTTAAIGAVIIHAGVAFVSGISVTGSSVAAPIGFSTFNKLKEFLGSPGEGYQWHHIVEQSQINKSGFPATIIHSTNNIYAVSVEVHQKISGYYSSIQEFTNGMTVRNWLAGQSYDAQYAFGMKVLEMFGGLK